MFHAVAMPVSSATISIESGAAMMDHMSVHCDNLMQDNQKVHKCCSGAVLHSPSPLQIMPSNTHQDYVSLSPRLLRHTSDTLFRPPKFYPVLTG